MPRPVLRKPQQKPLSKPRKEPPARIIRNERVKQGREREPLKDQRRRARRRLSLILSIFLFIFIAAAFAALWSSPFRIQNVQAAGPDATGVQSTTLSALNGTLDYVLPRDSIFFFPESAVRSQILNQYPDISAITISRISFDTLAIASIPRESAFLWCGEAYASPTAAPLVSLTASSTAITTTSTVTAPAPSPCYDTDSQGDIFALDTSATSDTLRVYDSLASTTGTTASVLGQHVADANMIPNALSFVKEIKSLDVPIVALVIRDDNEADLYAQSGTRITYVLGTEETSSQLAVSAFPSLDLNDGTLQYVDLRFPGKVYFRKNNASLAGASATSTYSAAVSCYLTGKCAIH